MGNFNPDSFRKYFNEKIRKAVSEIMLKEDIQEIRLRSGKPLSVSVLGKEKFVTENGKITAYPQLGMVIEKDDIEYSFKAICDYSVHSFSKELSQGFITINGGHRVGICGTAVISEGKIETVKYISGLNFRIARQILGCADEIIKYIDIENPKGILIIGPPSSGKTTVLRDLCRQLSSRNRVSLIDERGEIAAVYQGNPQNDIGYSTDVFNGYPKGEGILTALRVMSPRFIITDEIGDYEDIEAIEKAMYGGAAMIASAHASNISELIHRNYIMSLIKQGVFKYIAVLGTNNELGKIKEITEVNKLAENYRNYFSDNGNYNCRNDYVKTT